MVEKRPVSYLHGAALSCRQLFNKLPDFPALVTASEFCPGGIEAVGIERYGVCGIGCIARGVVIRIPVYQLTDVVYRLLINHNAYNEVYFFCFYQT